MRTSAVVLLSFVWMDRTVAIIEPGSHLGGLTAQQDSLRLESTATTLRPSDTKQTAECK